MRISARILSLLLCLLVAGPMSASARALARPENRVGKIFSSPLKAASADLAQTLDARRESRSCGYDFASGVCKYLYGADDPVNRIDPSGNESLISLSIGSSISASVSGLYNGTDLIIQQSLQATIFGVQQGKNAQQILTGYYLDVAIGVGVGVVASKVIGLAGRTIYGAEVETFAGSASAASRTAARRANAILEGGEAAVEAAAANQLAGAGRGYGYLDKMLPGTLKEGSIIYSTVPPSRISGGLWATDGRAMVRAAGSSEAYRIGSQTVKPRDMVYAYRVKTKVPCAAGNAEWNYQNGEGGFPQFNIQQEDVGVLEKVAEFLLQ